MARGRSNLRVTFADVILGLYTPEDGRCRGRGRGNRSGFNEPLREAVTVSGEIVDAQLSQQMRRQLTQLLLAKMSHADVAQVVEKAATSARMNGCGCHPSTIPHLTAQRWLRAFKSLPLCIGQRARYNSGRLGRHVHA